MFHFWVIKKITIYHLPIFYNMNKILIRFKLNIWLIFILKLFNIIIRFDSISFFFKEIITCLSANTICLKFEVFFFLSSLVSHWFYFSFLFYIEFPSNLLIYSKKQFYIIIIFIFLEKIILNFWSSFLIKISS